MRPTLQTRLLFPIMFAATALICRAQEQATALKPLPEPFTAAEFQKHVVYLASDELAGRAPGSDGADKAARYLIRHLKEYGLKPLGQNDSWFQDFPLNVPDPTTGTVTARNVVAIVPGQGELSEEAVIVCAHYDHIGSKPERGRAGEDTVYNGADDNASGLAALLLNAKALAAEPTALPESHRTVLFIAFDAEEKGLLGAKHYMQRPLWPLDKTAAAINFDAIGRLRLGKFFAMDAESNPLLSNAVRDAARERQLVAETRFGGHGRSDHVVFIERGIPGMHFFTGANSDYHQVSDHWEKLNFEGGATVAWIASQVLNTAIAHSEPIEYHEIDPSFDMTFLLNLAQTLGIVPNVNAQEGNYPQILFVIPNSPAAKHGLKSGDEITAINGLPFNRVEDGLTIFQQLTLEDGVRISVLRGERKSDVTIPASVFEAMSGPKATQLENGKYEVEFRYQAARSEKTVDLVGEFNSWKPTAHRMDGPDRNSLFTIRLELPEGAHEYKFVIDGKEWKTDPQNLYRVGKDQNSVVWVGSRPK